MRVLDFGIALLTASSLLGRSNAISGSHTSSLQRPLSLLPADGPQATTDNGTLLALLDALHSMQSSFYELSLATWPDAIDWTAAVIATHVFSSITTLHSALSSHSPTIGAGKILNEISRYFIQSATSFYGQNALGIRYQANDDMLWVTLEWLEALKLISLSASSQSAVPSTDYFANQYIPLYAHRARVFWDLASQGYDTVLCGGGMTWNNRLAPYKNAITNELFISASVGMYMYFPGDNDTSPYTVDGPRDKRYLDAAVQTYDWLLNSNMTNTAGLFVDGFHIRGWSGGPSGSNGTGQCDQRNDMVYSYNQGVLLSGQRDLYLATGNETFLRDGHALIQASINGTGWPEQTLDNASWKGLGAAGVMEDYCDALGSCNQDGQLFKGIFFNHFAWFCEALPATKLVGGEAKAGEGSGTGAKRERELKDWHRKRCLSYTPWVRHNALAALGTRDEKGVMGMWWTAGLSSNSSSDIHATRHLLEHLIDERKTMRHDGVDYRNGEPLSSDSDSQSYTPSSGGSVVHEGDETEDPNLRGRGRTVETQSSGLSVIMALLRLELLAES